MKKPCLVSPSYKIMKKTCLILSAIFSLVCLTASAAPNRWLYQTYRTTLTFEQITPALGIYSPDPTSSLALPDIPVTALINTVHNSVVIGFRIGADGKVAAVKVVSTSDPILGAASKKVVESWQFTPAKSTRDDKPVAVDIQCRFDITFSENAALINLVPPKKS